MSVCVIIKFLEKSLKIIREFKFVMGILLMVICLSNGNHLRKVGNMFNVTHEVRRITVANDVCVASATDIFICPDGFCIHFRRICQMKT